MIVSLMKRRLFVLLCCCLAAVLGFTLYGPSLASQEDAEEYIDEEENVDLEESIEFTSPSRTRDLITFDILKDIERAKALLEPMKCGFTVVAVKSGPEPAAPEKKKVTKKQKKGLKAQKAKKGKKKATLAASRRPVRNELGEFSILLAVENITTREIKVIRVHPKLGAESEGVLAVPGKSNGVNTKFTIVYPEHHVVLALKRPVRQGASFKEVVYTPYSDNLDIAQVRQTGLDYLRSTVRAAKMDLLRRKVVPLSCDRFVPDDIPLTLAIIEHIDPVRFESGKYTAEQLIHETLVIIGTNKGDAYAYSKSKAGAQGLFQFIPDTYKRIARLYPQAGLHEDFVEGMRDHVNAAKASFLLFDADTGVLNDDKREQMLRQSDAWGRFLASAYNCGSGKTRKAMDKTGRNWTLSVPSETQIYVKKYDVVRDWLRQSQ